jgi:uncharacterized membrane protein
MTKGRLESFSDNVMSVIITLTVLDLKIPYTGDWKALEPVVPVFLTYLLSFTFVGIYWNNHHHMLHAANRINGKILWANLHLLFWLSLIPFVTGWMGGNHFQPLPTALYGIVMMLVALAYFVVQQAILEEEGPASKLAAALGRDVKGKLTPVLYAVAIALTFFDSRISLGIYIAVALMWLVPNPRIEWQLRQP